MLLRRLKIKYLAALAVLMASLLAVGGATFAWFAINTQVSADGMQIRVVSEGTFMLIAPGTLDAAGVQAYNQSTAEATNKSAPLFPAKHETVANITQADNISNWYYRTSSDPGSYGGEGKESGKLALSTGGTFSDFVLVNDFSLTVAQGANALRDLKVESCSVVTAGDQAVKVLVATAHGAEEFSASHTAGSVILSSGNITDATVVHIKVYIYWDGADTDVYTNNIDDLLNTSVELIFSGDIVEPT